MNLILTLLVDVCHKVYKLQYICCLLISAVCSVTELYELV